MRTTTAFGFLSLFLVAAIVSSAPLYSTSTRMAGADSANSGFVNVRSGISTYTEFRMEFSVLSSLSTLSSDDMTEHEIPWSLLALKGADIRNACRLGLGSTNGQFRAILRENTANSTAAKPYTRIFAVDSSLQPVWSTDFKNDAIIVTVSPDSAAVHVMTWDALRWKGDKFNYWISASGEVSCLDDSADVQCLSYYPGAFSSDGSIFYCDDAHPKDNPGANITVRAYATGSWSQLWQTSASISDYVLMNYGPLSSSLWGSFGSTEVFVTGFNSGNGKIIAPALGREIVGTAGGAPPRLSPDGSIVYYFVQRAILKAFSVKSMKLLWTYNFSDSWEHSYSSEHSIAPDGSVVFAFARYNPTRALVLKSLDGTTGSKKWEYALPLDYLDASGGVIGILPEKGVGGSGVIVWVPTTSSGSVYLVDVVLGPKKVVAIPKAITPTNGALCLALDADGVAFIHVQGHIAYHQDDKMVILPLSKYL